MAFPAKILLLYGSWIWVNPNSFLATPLTYYLGEMTAWVLDLAGLMATVVHQPGTMICVAGISMLKITPACDGVNVMGLFICYVLAFPARWHSKACFLPLGLLAIHLFNSVRIVLLCLNYYYDRPSFYFNHQYTFVALMHGSVFLLWTKCPGKYADIINTSEQKKTTPYGLLKLIVMAKLSKKKANGRSM